MTLQQLLMTKRFGLIIRTFAVKPDFVEDQVKAVMETVQKALEMHTEEKPIFGRIDVLVSADQDRQDSDCGLSAAALRKSLYDLQNQERIFVSEVRHGDIFCGILNYGIAHQLRDRVDYSMILSTQVRSYFNSDTVLKMIEALANKALAVGVAIEELSDSIQKGRIANTFSLWDNVALMTVGGFDLRAAKPRKDEKLIHYLQGWSKEKGEVYYQFAGVEEIIPLIRLIRTFGSCIASIKPQGIEAKEWVAPDPAVNPEGFARHLKKMGTKFERQAAFAALENADLSFLEGGIMPEYRSK